MKLFEYPKGSGVYMHYCPGCQHGHQVQTPRWSFNGSLELPTFSPSLRHFYRSPNDGTEVTTCHYHIVDGNIAYCGDSPHEYAGKTIPLPDFPVGYQIGGKSVEQLQEPNP